MEKGLISVLIGDYTLNVFDTWNLPGIFKQKGWLIPSEEKEVLVITPKEELITTWGKITSPRYSKNCYNF